MKKIKLNQGLKANMRHLFMATLFLITIGCSSHEATATTAAPPQQMSVSFQLFYDDLAPYGSWVSYSNYGYVWVPGIGMGFRPYLTNGYWAYTEMGWMWVSYYDWGWAPFHYGSWIYDPVYGWMWVPGYNWSPAWVVWGSYNGYYGWAPVAPGFSISVGYYPSMDYWCFAHPRYMITADLSNHYYGPRGGTITIEGTVINNEKNITIINNVSRYNNQSYNAGPSRQEVEKVAQTSIKPVAIGEREKPGKTEVRGDAVNIYRPKINKEGTATAKPSKVVPLDNLKQMQGGPDRAPQKAGGKDGENKPALQRPPEMKQQPEKEMKKPKEAPQPESKPERKIAQPEPAPQPPKEARPEREMPPSMDKKKQIERSLPERKPESPQPPEEKQQPMPPPSRQESSPPQNAIPKQENPVKPQPARRAPRVKPPKQPTPPQDQQQKQQPPKEEKKPK